MFGRYRLAAVLILGLFGAGTVANSAATQPALPEVSEPTIQLAQLYNACRSCRSVCSQKHALCRQHAHGNGESLRFCRVRYHACLGGCPCR